MPPASTNNPPPPRWLLGPWPAVLLGLVCYANSLGNGLVYDDNAVISGNPRIQSLTNFRDIWLRDWWYDKSQRADLQMPQRDRLYRPLTMYSFALNYAVHGLRPLGYHLVNVLLHAAACGLLWSFARRLTGDAVIAGLTAVVFAVHPVHCEAVANGVGRAEVLAALFMLIGLTVILPNDGRLAPWRYVIAGALFFGALLSKETAVCYLPVALLALYFVRRNQSEPIPSWAKRAALLAIPLLIYFPLRFIALEKQFIRDEADQILFNPLTDARGLERVLTTFTLLGHYARLTIAPSTLSSDYGYAIVDPHHPWNLMTGLGVLAAAALAYGLAQWRSRNETRRLVAMLVAMLLASYVLISNTLLLIGVSLAERLWYWPSIPALLLVCVLLRAGWRRFVLQGDLKKSATLLGTLGAALLAGLALRTVVRNADWKSDLILFTADAATFPQGAHLASTAGKNLAIKAVSSPDALERLELLSQAEVHLQRALKIKQRFPEAIHRLAMLYLMRGERDKARSYLETALKLDPTNGVAQSYLNLLEGADPETQARIADLKAQLRTTPQAPGLHVALGEALMKTGDTISALDAFAAAVSLAPDDVPALRWYGEALMVTYQMDRALRVFNHLLELSPDDWEAHADLAVLLKQIDPVKSLAHAKRAYELNGTDLRAVMNYAEALHLNQRTAEGLELLRNAEKSLKPDDPFRTVITERIQELQARP